MSQADDSTTILRLVSDTSDRKPATAASIAALEFGPADGFAGLSSDEVATRVRNLSEEVRITFLIAGHLLRFSKDELVEKVAANLEMFGPLLMKFADAAATATAVREVIQTAECRLAVAVAIVEGPDDDPPGEERDFEVAA